MSIILAIAYFFFVIITGIFDFLSDRPGETLPSVFFVIFSDVILIYIATSLKKAEIIVKGDTLIIKKFLCALFSQT